MSFCACGRQRRLRQKLLPGHAAAAAAAAPASAARRADDEPIGAEGFLVEEVRVLQPLEHRSVGRACSASAESAGGSIPIADISPSASGLYGNGDEMPGGAAVGDPQLAARPELVALGVAAEVVVVVEDQDARLRRLVRAR